ncbi:MAG: tRNA pseudouridine(38-40) synthase TruA [Myxococcaceae bacterium]
MQLKTWRLWISYLGTDFVGFQKQPGQRSIESALQEALLKLTAQTPILTGAGRTDAGVHARGQVVSCSFESRFDYRTLPIALSHYLGPAICVYQADEMPTKFDAKRQSIGKRYVYRINALGKLHPFKNLYTWDLRQKLDLAAMREAATYLIGEHDFESFRSVHCVAAHAKRYVWKIGDLTPGPSPETGEGNSTLEIDIRGNAFCHNMVRIIVGTLVEVGLGKLKPMDIPVILAKRDRTQAGRTAPAHGLTLEEVYYPDNLKQAEIPEGAIFPRYPVTRESWPC